MFRVVVDLLVPGLSFKTFRRARPVLHDRPVSKYQVPGIEVSVPVGIGNDHLIRIPNGPAGAMGLMDEGKLDSLQDSGIIILLLLLFSVVVPVFGELLGKLDASVVETLRRVCGRLVQGKPDLSLLLAVHDHPALSGSRNRVHRFIFIFQVGI